MSGAHAMAERGTVSLIADARTSAGAAAGSFAECFWRPTSLP
jgi:hypothetical protein